jgi:predicted nucleotidyltransferase
MLFFKNLTELPFVEKIILYGSRARGDNRERSDIDMAMVCPTASETDWQKVLSIIDDEEIWLTMLKDRNQTSHTYEEELATQIYHHIQTYYPVMQKTYLRLNEKYGKH